MVHPNGDEESGCLRGHEAKTCLRDVKNNHHTAEIAPNSERRHPATRRSVDDQSQSQTTKFKKHVEFPDRGSSINIDSCLILQEIPLEDTLSCRDSSEQKRVIEVCFEDIQRIHLFKLRIKLAQHLARFESISGDEFRLDAVKDDWENSSWEEDFQRYVQGLRDYEYVILQRLRDNLDLEVPNAISGATSLKSAATLSRGPTSNTHAPSVKSIESHSRAPLKFSFGLGNFPTKLIVALVGAFYLLLPMYTIVETSVVSPLVVAAVCVLFFGLSMAGFLEDHTQVLSSTMAYGAVLVVFVGLQVERNTTGSERL